ncbi:MAG: Sporulation related domain protein [Candidatus Omnitrophica bacterium ADurb.Bin314]|jgi:cell division septation protein DedD|nr:MAG: Sporulation related domain protein [Candidatus Omnitrophica bacterium ADurb.Bin314]
MQTELFEMSMPVTEEAESSVEKQNVLEKTFISLRLDQTIGIVLVLLVFYIISFTFGFEKGKRSVRDSQVIRTSPETTVAQPLPAALPKDLIVYEDASSIPSPAQAAVIATVHEPVPAASASKAMPSAKEDSKAGAVRPSGKYTIQHVIYTSRAEAEREVNKLLKKGEKAFILPSKKYQQVCVAGFNTKKEADQYMRQLRSQRIISGDSYVRNMPA